MVVWWGICHDPKHGFYGIALSSRRFLNRGVQPATPFWRIASPREGRRRHGVRWTPHMRKVRARGKKCAGAVGEKARTREGIGARRAQEGIGARRTQEGIGARRERRKLRYTPRGHAASPCSTNSERWEQRRGGKRGGCWRDLKSGRG